MLLGMTWDKCFRSNLRIGRNGGHTCQEPGRFLRINRTENEVGLGLVALSGKVVEADAYGEEGLKDYP